MARRAESIAGNDGDVLAFEKSACDFHGIPRFAILRDGLRENVKSAFGFRALDARNRAQSGEDVYPASRIFLEHRRDGIHGSRQGCERSVLRDRIYVRD